MNLPLLSIIVCTYNRDTYLRICLEHLNKLQLPTDQFEILVVDNNSTDNTAAVCEEFQQRQPQLDLSYLLETQQGLSYSRNLGLNKAKAPYISYLDDDAFANPDYAQNIIDYFEKNPQVDAIGGKITPIYEGTKPDWMSKYLLPLVAALDMGTEPVPFKGLKFPIGANMAFRQSALVGLKGFNTDLGRKGHFLGSGEEKDLFYRLQASNKIIHYVPNVHVNHSIPESRTQSEYIRRMATGVGKSEALRLQGAPVTSLIAKWLEEFFKIGATVILATYYTLILKWPKANMLVKFRWWVLTSFIKS